MLERFAVFRCAECGLVDADGRLVDPPAGAPRGSFAAPPPVDAVAELRREGGGAAGVPSILLATLGASFFFTALVVAGSERVSWCGVVAVLVVHFALLTGRPWARVLSVFGSLVGIVLDLVVLVAFCTTPLARAVIVGDIASSAFWLYVLARPDVTRYFERAEVRPRASSPR